MKNSLLKSLLVCVACCMLHTTASAQNDFEITKVKSSKLIEVLNNVEFFQRGRTKDCVIRIYKLHNGAGSAGNNNGEVSYNLLVAISEFDQLPNQNLFEIGPFLNPVFLEWEDNEDEGIFSLAYGQADKRLEITLGVNIERLTIMKPDK